MNKLLIYGGSLVGIVAIGLLSYSDPKQGAIAGLILVGLIILSPTIKEIKSFKAGKDGLEINEEACDESKPKE